MHSRSPCQLLLAGVFAMASATAAAQGSSAAVEDHLAAAQRAQSQANCHLAAQEYRAAVLLLPANGELRTNEAIALFCDGQLEAALAEFHTALRAKASLITPHLFLGLANFRLGHFDTAKRELTLYLAHKGDDLTAHLWLGYTFAAQYQHAAAQAQFTEVLARDPANLDALYAFGQSTLELAHEKAHELKTIDPSGVQLLKLSATAYRLRGDVSQAQAADQEALQRTPQSQAIPTEAETRAAELAAQAAAAEAQAFKAFQTILATASDSYQAHEVLGDAMLASHHDEAAIPEYEAVLRLKPDLPGMHETLSECLVSTGRFAEALEALHAERALTPVASARLLTRIGQAEHAMGQDDEAAQALHEALQHTDAPPQAWLLLAQVQLAQGHAEAAVPSLQHFLRLRPDSSVAFYALSRAFRTLGDHAGMTQALADYQRTSDDAKARALLAPLSQESPAVSFAESPLDAVAAVPPPSNP